MDCRRKDWAVSFSSGGRELHVRIRAARLWHAVHAAGGLTLDLAWGGNGTAADFAGRDIKGKAVLIQDILTPGVLNRWINNEGAVQRAIDNGAAAVGIIYGVADNFSLWEGARTGPGFNVGFEDGKVLRELLGKEQPVKVTLKVTGEMKSGLKTASVLGTLPGTTDEEIIVMAHMDAYFDGAIDNGFGRRRDDGAVGAFREGSRGAAASQHPLHGLRRPSRRSWRKLAARCARTPSWRRPSS